MEQLPVGRGEVLQGFKASPLFNPKDEQAAVQSFSRSKIADASRVHDRIGRAPAASSAGLIDADEAANSGPLRQSARTISRPAFRAGTCQARPSRVSRFLSMSAEA